MSCERRIDVSRIHVSLNLEGDIFIFEWDLKKNQFVSSV